MQRNLFIVALALACSLHLGSAKRNPAGKAAPAVSVKAPSTQVNCNCQCDNYTWKDKYGRTQGNCRRYGGGRKTRQCTMTRRVLERSSSCPACIW